VNNNFHLDFAKRISLSKESGEKEKKKIEKFALLLLVNLLLK